MCIRDRSLEDELNMTLLNRTRSGVIITPQGERIYAYAIEVLKNINMINEFKKGQEIETLSISSVPSNTLSFYLSQFYNINKQEKGIQIDFFETNVQNVIRRVHARKSELGFVYISKRSMSAFRQQKMCIRDRDILVDLAELFKVLGDQTRIKIIFILFKEEMCVCDIAELVGMTQSAISHQLRVLKQARLVKFRKEGKTVFYSLDDDHITKIFDYGLHLSLIHI